MIKKSVYIILTIYLAFLVYAVGDLSLIFLTCSYGILTWIIWHLFSHKLLMHIIPSKVKRSGLVISKAIELKPLTVLEFFKKSFMILLFSYTAISLLYQILGLEAGGLMGFVYQLVYSFFSLPFTTLLVSKWILDTINIVYVDEKEPVVKEVDVYGYLEELIGFGAFLGFILYFNQNVLQSGNIGYAIGFQLGVLMILLSPSFVAVLLYYLFSYKKQVTEVLSKHKFYRFNVVIRFKCPTCGKLLDAKLSVCPYCGTVLFK